jgi:hypothetical protein
LRPDDKDKPVGLNDDWTEERWMLFPAKYIGGRADVSGEDVKISPSAGWRAIPIPPYRKCINDQNRHLANKLAETDATEGLYWEVHDHWRIVVQYQVLKEIEEHERLHAARQEQKSCNSRLKSDHSGTSFSSDK